VREQAAAFILRSLLRYAMDHLDERSLTFMLDIIFIALSLIFFAVAFWYVTFCERV